MPWNYPLLCAVNTVVAATLAGNSVLLKHSDRTPTAADWFEKTFAAAGAPPGLVQAFHADHQLVEQVIANPKVAYVQFTGSVAGGRAIYQATSASRFIDVVRNNKQEHTGHSSHWGVTMHACASACVPGLRSLTTPLCSALLRPLSVPCFSCLVGS